MMNRLLFVLIGFCLIGDLFAADYPVSDAAAIRAALLRVQPGDTITMKAGTWSNQEILFSAKGAPGDSILLRAEIPGKTILSGTSRLIIDGMYLKVEGLRILGGYNTEGAIEFATDSRYCRLTNTSVEEFNPPQASTRYHWVTVKGAYNRLDHCLLKGKRHSGVMLLVSLSSSVYGYHRVDHNSFIDRPMGNGNGYETLKVAGGDYSDLDGNCLIEHNYFERCNGESEIVSNKCHHNTYRYNTFVECQGSLVLRQGTHCLVEGNFFFGKGVAETGGIRITHRGHLIINNYFQDLKGMGSRSAVVLHAGMDNQEYVPGSGGHVLAESLLMVHNTIVNCASGIYSGYLDSDDSIRRPPKDNTFANNLITLSGTAQCVAENPLYKGINMVWAGNMFWAEKIGDVPASGYVMKNPSLQFVNGWFQITESSPAIDAAVDGYPMVKEDIDGILRGLKKDIGADEVGAGPRRPLGPMDVGPGWYRALASDITFAENSPLDFRLDQNFPNPFNPLTNVEFRLPTTETVKLSIYDLLGHEVAVLVNQVKPAGIYNVQWNASGFSSGIYFYRLQAGTYVGAKKLVLLR